MSRTDVRNAIFCAAAVTAVFLLTNPFAQTPFNDDWTYAFSVRELLRTGRMTYHCGESAAFLTQAYWGVLFAKLFGFSFVTLRFSTLPWAAGSVALCYLLARQANLRPALAILATMLFGFSPLFLPLATSFMSDVPSTFFILLSIYAFVLAATASDPHRALALLILAFVATLIGGLNRQIVWLIPLTSGPYVAWLRRRERPILIASLIGIAINFLVALIAARWFYAQPYVVIEWSFLTTMKTGLRTWRYSLATWLSVWLTTLLLILPAALPAAWLSLVETCRNLRHRRGALAAVIAVLIALEIAYWPTLSIEPWLGDVVSRRGILSGMELAGQRPVSQPLILREFLAALVIVVAWLFLTDIAGQLFKAHPVRRLTAFFQPADNRITIPAMLLFAGGYMALLAYRSPRGLIFDRYSLPLIPCVVIPLLLKSQTSRRQIGIPLAVAWGTFVVWGVYAIAATQDVHALGTARRIAMDRLLSAGIPDTAIACGSEFDNWTQLVYTGHVIAPGVNAPFFPSSTESPIVRYVYRVEFNPEPDTAPSSFGFVDYFSLLPPFHRRIFIDRYRNPIWLDPTRNIPPPNDYDNFHFD